MLKLKKKHLDIFRSLNAYEMGESCHDLPNEVVAMLDKEEWRLFNYYFAVWNGDVEEAITEGRLDHTLPDFAVLAFLTHVILLKVEQTLEE